MTVALALAAALVYGSADFCGGLASRRMPAAAVVAVSQVAGALVLALAWIALPQYGHLRVGDVLIGAAAGVAGAAAITALYAALAIGRMGVVSPITAVVGASVPVAVGYAFGVHPAGLGSLGVACAFVAVVLVSVNAETRAISLREPGLGLALLAGLAIGGLLILLSRGQPDAVFARLGAARLCSVVVLLAYALARREALRPPPGNVRLVLGAGALDMAANILYVFAAAGGELAIVAVITSLYPAGTVFLARIVLHERLTRLQWCGVALAAAGVVLIARG